MKIRMDRAARAGRVTVVLAMIFLASCAAGDQQAVEPSGQTQTLLSSLEPGQRATDQAEFRDYWYQGLAELNVYDLQQARYGALRDGQAVLIYVTEDLNRKSLVKSDDPRAAGDDAVKVLKLNFTRDFQTGIYAYRTMQSLFSPVDRSRDPHLLRATTTVQEWCGHVFMDLRRESDGYTASVHSYFEGESAQGHKLGDAIPEEAIWNLVRLDPGALPTGTFQAIPNNLDMRLRHLPLEVTEARASLMKGEDGRMRYELHYPARNRTLRLEFDEAFPHVLRAWEETVLSRGVELTTKAVLREQRMIDYWNRSRVEDEYLRTELGLP
jgi:hypothetical protein